MADINDAVSMLQENVDPDSHKLDWRGVKGGVYLDGMQSYGLADEICTDSRGRLDRICRDRLERHSEEVTWNTIYDALGFAVKQGRQATLVQQPNNPSQLVCRDPNLYHDPKCYDPQGGISLANLPSPPPTPAPAKQVQAEVPGLRLASYDR